VLGHKEKDRCFRQLLDSKERVGAGTLHRDVTRSCEDILSKELHGDGDDGITAVTPVTVVLLPRNTVEKGLDFMTTLQ